MAREKEKSLGKARRGEKELTKAQELKHENRELRNEVHRLEKENRQLRRQFAGSRKQFAKMDLDRHSWVKDIVQEHLAQEDNLNDTPQQVIESLKNKWKCHECHMGHLEINLFTKAGETWYYRHCSNCDNRTNSQVYTPKVEGIIKEAPLPPMKPERKR